MARKSRKETVVLPAPEIDTSCRAGVYVRLSVEDKHTHTASIETQQLIIARYLEQNPEIIVVQTYIDMKTPSLIQFNDLRRLAGRGGKLRGQGG